MEEWIIKKVQLIINKVMDKYTNNSSVLIQGVKGKFMLSPSAAAPVQNLSKISANARFDLKL